MTRVRTHQRTPPRSGAGNLSLLCLAVLAVGFAGLLQLALGDGGGRSDGRGDRIAASGQVESTSASGAGVDSAAAMRPLPDPLYGVTVESVENLSGIVDSLSRHSRMPTTRIVFQEGTKAASYKAAVDAVHPVSYVMGQLLDSEGVANTTVDLYRERTRSFVDAYKQTVDVWEIGNEVNGEWLVRAPQGETEQQEVVAKIAAAYDVAEAQDLRTALTLSYFPSADCRANPWEDMMWWAKNRVPDRMKQGLDYVLVSWYEESCSPQIRPDVNQWNAVFSELRSLFPGSKLGFGEVGTIDAEGATLEQRQELVSYYYGLSKPGGIAVPGFVGGYFWWYYAQEAAPYDRPASIWPALEEAMLRY